MSLPSRERGLKYQLIQCYAKEISVAPFAGAWIEILTHRNISIALVVAPFAGAWIEIGRWEPGVEEGARSLPSRERGLK